LALELGPVRMRETRARLGLQFVARQVLRLEREGLGEVGVEVGGALAGDAVEQVERDVVKSGITENVQGAADVFGLRSPLEDAQKARLEGLRAERHTIDTVA